MTEFFAADCLKRFALIALCTFASSSSSLAQEQTTFEIVSSTAPTLNFYGLPGIIDMPSGEAMQNAQVALGFSHFAGTTRSSFSFQFSPRITATFRYSGLKDLHRRLWRSLAHIGIVVLTFAIFLLKEKAYSASNDNVGLQDFAGTGIYSAEYLAHDQKLSATLQWVAREFQSNGWPGLGALRFKGLNRFSAWQKSTK